MKRLTKQWVWSASLAVASMLVGSAACARGVYWSVDADAPVVVGGNVHTQFSNAPQVRYVQPQPVIVAPAPVYVERPWCPPRAVYASPQRVVVGAYPNSEGWRYRRDWRDERGWARHEHWEHERREHHGYGDDD